MEADRDTTKDVVTRFFRALTDGQFDAAETMVDADGPWSIPRKRQVGTIGDQLALMRTENMAFHVDTLTAEEDRVAAIVGGVMHRPAGDALEKSYHFLLPRCAMDASTTCACTTTAGCRSAWTSRHDATRRRARNDGGTDDDRADR